MDKVNPKEIHFPPSKEEIWFTVRIFDLPPVTHATAV